eukprot:TRINITY_DN920_c2_g1_i1.p1 TRINITY_DN920_c2_g1~~TRINITY_DN920_c2_g1_i1.p1  ORF type:complete len:242 (+),score=74.79 TRINITY_DN920_c2_g1_i1:85-726(+)
MHHTQAQWIQDCFDIITLSAIEQEPSVIGGFQNLLTEISTASGLRSKVAAAPEGYRKVLCDLFSLVNGVVVTCDRGNVSFEQMDFAAGKVPLNLPGSAFTVGDLDEVVSSCIDRAAEDFDLGARFRSGEIRLAPLPPTEDAPRNMAYYIEQVQEGVVDSIRGLFRPFIHPKETFDDMKYAVTHPKEVAVGLYNGAQENPVRTATSILVSSGMS